MYSEKLDKKLRLPIEIVNGSAINTFLKFWTTFRKLQPDIIVFVNGGLGVLPWFAYLAAKICGATRVIAIEQLIGQPLIPVSHGGGVLGDVRRLLGWRMRAMWKIRMEGILCDKVICVSHAVRTRLVDEYHFPRDKAVVIHNGVDLKCFAQSADPLHLLRQSLGISEHDLVVVCVARLSVAKRIDLLLEAMAEIQHQPFVCKCVIVGNGPLEKELVQQAEALSLGDSVLFVGHKDDVRPYLEMADIFVLSSIREGLPLSLAEAMASGKPCVATNVGGNREIIDHGRTGLIVEPGQARDLAQAISQFLANPQLRKEMGARGLEKVNREFDFDTLLAELMDVVFDEYR